jgi:surface antigen
MLAVRLPLIVIMMLTVAACMSRSATSVVSAYQAIGTWSGIAPTDAAAGEEDGGSPDDAFLIEALRASVDERDKPVAIEAQLRALEWHGPGASVRWSNPRTKVRGEVVPGPVYAVNAQQCRDFRHTVERVDANVSARASACRSPDGTWTLLD